MVTDEQIEELTVAAETIYKYCDHKNGFNSGVVINPDTGRKEQAWNIYSGAKHTLEHKLGRSLSGAEITILALAIGAGPMPYLSKDTKNAAMDMCWQRQSIKHVSGAYVPMMRVLTSIY